ncbi:hypothetical protein TNCV_4396491 [Trichonephila clavipes]|uniref:Uncharacterized protein n=1 Tax=Trichonephila clavipes TaxID=2585209 RepID=A0A8X6W5D0_TRICX|nr:hypothetical protein TNCV_4396491 [Trichonephila clavipes]
MSSFLGFCEGDTRNRWRDGQVCPDVDKELWRQTARVGQTARVCLGVLCANRTREVKRYFGKRKRGEEEKEQESPGERTDGRRRDGKEREETERESARERVKPALNGKQG